MWVKGFVSPRVGAIERVGQQMSNDRDAQLDEGKAQLTWETSDRFLHIVSRGTTEEHR